MIKQTVGIDIGSENIKIVCLDKADDVYKLSCCGYYPYKGNQEKLKEFLSKRTMPAAAEYRINIEDPSLKIRRLDLPKMDEKETGEAVKWGLKDVVEGDVDAYAYQYITIHPDDLKTSNKVPLVAFAVRSSALEDRLNFVKKLGLPAPAVVEPNVSSVASIFGFYMSSNLLEGRMIVDIGSSLSVFAVVGKNGVLFSRPLGGCSDSNLVDQVSRDLNMDLKEADKTKNEYFFGKANSTLKENNVLKNTVSHFFSKMAIEVQRSIDGYTLMFGNDQQQIVYLCGGGAYYPGLVEYMSKTLGLQIKLFDPFLKIDVLDFKCEQFDAKRALFTVACGLAVD